MAVSIVGDLIEWDGQPVAVFRQDIPATVREWVSDALEGTVDPDDDSLHTECDAEICNLKEQVTDLEDERDELETKLGDAYGKCDAYAALLGVKP